MKDPTATAFPSPAGGAEEPRPATSIKGPPDGSPSSRVTLALERLGASRQALRRELLPPVEAQDGADSSASGDGLSLHRLWRRLRRWARNSAPASVLLAALEQTWRVHPLRPVGAAIAEGYRSQVAPLMRKHPWATVAAAAGLGALLMFGRRRHGPLLASTLRPLPQRLGRWLLLQLTSAPVQTALAAWLMMRTASSPAAEAGDASNATAPTTTVDAAVGSAS